MGIRENMLAGPEKNNTALVERIVKATLSIPNSALGSVLYPKIGVGKNIIRVSGGGFSAELSTVDGCAEQWKRWMDDCKSRGLFNKRKFGKITGLYCRYKKNGSAASAGVYGKTFSKGAKLSESTWKYISNHAFGNAIDFMPCGPNQYSNGKYGGLNHPQCVLEFVEIGVKYNWRWGGAYGDNMHFEYVGGLFGGQKSNYTGREDTAGTDQPGPDQPTDYAGTSKTKSEILGEWSSYLVDVSDNKFLSNETTADSVEKPSKETKKSKNSTEYESKQVSEPKLALDKQIVNTKNKG